MEGLEVTDDSEEGRGESRDRSDECKQSSTQRLSSCLGRQENDTTGGANPAWCWCSRGAGGMELNSINDSSMFFRVVGVNVGVVRVGIPHVKPSILEH